MVKEKACRKCKLIVEGQTCPICNGNDFANVIQGKVNIIDADKSVISKKLNHPQKGRYGIKIR
jgi:DNA-directed RNA polymerase subunit E"